MKTLISALQSPTRPSNVIVVTRHKGAVEWLRQELASVVQYGWNVFHELNGSSLHVQFMGPTGHTTDGADVPIIAEATPDNVRGKIVIGNLPLSLAALASVVYAIEFSGAPPRGAEYGAKEMQAAGANLSPYRVSSGGVSPYPRPKKGWVPMLVIADANGAAYHPGALPEVCPTLDAAQRRAAQMGHPDQVEIVEFSYPG